MADAAAAGDGWTSAESKAEIKKRHKVEMTEVLAGKKQTAEKKAREKAARARHRVELKGNEPRWAVEEAEEAAKNPPKPEASDDADGGAAVADGMAELKVDDDDDADDNKDADKPFDKTQTKAYKKRKAKEAKEKARALEIEEQKANAGPTDRAIELSQLGNRLTPRQLQIKEIEADGHCLYRAVAHQLELYPYQHADDIKRVGVLALPVYLTLRDRTSAHMLQNPADFAPFVTGEDGEELSSDAYVKYCHDITNDPPVWGGQPEIVAMCQSLERSIIVFRADSAEPLVMGEEFASREKPLQLSYHQKYWALGEHYNSVVPM
jgi:OTU domain-containing protein 6